MQTADKQRNRGGQCNLLNHKWKAFDFVELFDIRKGFYNKKPPCYENGNIPFIGATDSNNGITGFSDYPTIEANSKVGYGSNESIDRKLFPGNAICVTNNGSVGYAYYQPTEFTCTHDVNPLYLREASLNRHLAMFLIACIEKQRVCFTYARKWRPKRMVHSKLMLPIDASNNPDWAFMEQFMQEVERDILATTLKYFHNKQNTNTITPPSKNQLTYKDFLLRNLFHLLEPGKSKGLNHLQRKERGISYLGATNLNNGVLGFVEPVPSMVQRGNCIAFIRNGEGSMGYAVYKAEDFIATSDMTIGYNAHLNKYTGIYITTIADRIRGKYNFGYKRNAQRLAKEIITLPTTPDGNPDWEYMEAYMRQIESRQILAYLSHIAHRA